MIYSGELKDYIQHFNLAMDILHEEKLYLSKGKLIFLADELKLLSRIIDKNGIEMDPEKVNQVLAWKTPTNRDQVGFLADDIPNVRSC